MTDIPHRETGYLLTVEDAVGAGKDSMYWRLRRPLSRLFFWGGMIVFTAWTAMPDRNRDWTRLSSDILAGVILWLLIYFGVRIGVAFTTRSQMRRWFAQNKAMQLPLRAAWTDHAITVGSSRGHWTYDWSDFVGWGVNERMCRLYTTDRQMILIPVRALTPSQRDDIVARLQEAGSPRR